MEAEYHPVTAPPVELKDVGLNPAPSVSVFKLCRVEESDTDYTELVKPNPYQQPRANQDDN